MDQNIAAELDELAGEIARLRPISSRDPEAFYEQRSELASRARQLADKARGRGAPPAARTAPLPKAIGSQVVKHEVRHSAGRTVLVLTKSQRVK